MNNPHFQQSAISSSISLSKVGRALLARLPAAASSQLGVLREIEIAVAARRRELETQCAPLLRAARMPSDARTRDASLQPIARRLRPRVDRSLTTTAGAAAAARVPPPPPHGTVLTIAGSGEEGDADGPAAAASFSWPHACVEGRDGALYICDMFNHRIRKLQARRRRRRSTTFLLFKREGTRAYVNLTLVVVVYLFFVNVDICRVDW